MNIINKPKHKTMKIINNIESFTFNIEKSKKAGIVIAKNTDSMLKYCIFGHSLIVQYTNVNKIFYFKVKNIDYTNSSKKGNYCCN